jgi:hypothetical protein
MSSCSLLASSDLDRLLRLSPVPAASRGCCTDCDGTLVSSAYVSVDDVPKVGSNAPGASGSALKVGSSAPEISGNALEAGGSVPEAGTIGFGLASLFRISLMGAVDLELPPTPPLPDAVDLLETRGGSTGVGNSGVGMPLGNGGRPSS